MSASTWPIAFEALLKHEGGFVNHPRDPGGITNLGVTKRVWEEWVNHPVDEDDMRALKPALVEPLYRKRYWDKIRGDDLPPGIDLAVMDYAVNSGPGRAAKTLQEVVGVPADGSLGPKTLAAVAGADALTVISDLCNARLAFLRLLPTWETFGRGWWARVEQVRKQASMLARHPSQE